MITQELVLQLRDRDKQLHAWTVDSPPALKHVLDAGAPRCAAALSASAPSAAALSAAASPAACPAHPCEHGRPPHGQGGLRAARLSRALPQA
jgi:hypothetical protein